MTIGRVDINEKDLSKICGAVIQLEERADSAEGVVHTDIAQSLTETEQTQGRSNIYAAPLDALAYNGMQINGSMEVSQEYGTSSIALNSVSSVWITDGWKGFLAGTMAVNGQQVADAPPGFSNSAKLTVTTAQASLVGSERVHFLSSNEGYRVERLQWGTASAQSLSIAFWSKIHRPGLYSAVIRNGAGLNRTYAFTFTHNVADAWEYKTVTIPGDTSGTWSTTLNLNWLFLSFAMAAGPSSLTAPNVWTAGSFFGATGTTNGVAATSDTFQITGVVLLPGIELPSAARSPLIMRPYDQELQICKRYYQKSFASNVAAAVAMGDLGNALSIQANGVTSNSDSGYVTFPVELRSAPTIILYNPVAAGFNSWRDTSTGVDQAAGLTFTGAKGLMIYISGTTAAGHSYSIHWSTDARL